MAALTFVNIQMDVLGFVLGLIFAFDPVFGSLHG